MQRQLQPVKVEFVMRIKEVTVPLPVFEEDTCGKLRLVEFVDSVVIRRAVVLPKTA